MAEEIVIGRLILDNSDLDRALLDSKKAIIELENEQKKLKKDTEGLSTANAEQLATFVANEASLKRLRGEYSESQKAVLAIVKAQTGLDDALKKTIKTEDEAIANNKALTEARRKLDTTTVEGAKAIADINVKINANNKLIKENGSELEKQKANVGNYPTLMNAVGSSFSGATTQIIGFGQKGKDIIGELSSTITGFKTTQAAATAATEALAAAELIQISTTEAATAATATATAIGFQYNQGLATETELEIANTAATVANAEATTARAAATAAATTATVTSTVATKALRIAMLSIPLVALLALLSPLIYFLASTQEGIDKITSVTRPLVAIFESLIGVAQNVGKSMFDAFSNPKQVLIDLMGFLKDQVVNRITGLYDILVSVATLDFEGLKNGLGKAVLGVDDLEGKIQRGSKATVDFLSEAAAKGAALDVLEKKLRGTRNDNILLLGKATEELKAQNRIAEDQTKTDKERETATLKTIASAKEINLLKNSELDIEIAILRNKQSRNDTSAAEIGELNKLLAKKNENNAAELELETTQNNKLVGIRKAASDKASAASTAALAKSLKDAQTRIDILKLEAQQSTLSTEQQIANAQKLFDMQNELAKRSSSGLDLKKALIQNQQELSTEILSIAADQIDQELELQKKAFAEAKNLTVEQRDAEITSATDLAIAQTLLLDKKLLTEKAYADELIKINAGKNDSIAIANKSFEESEAVRKQTEALNLKALNDVFFEIRMQDLTDQGATELELKTVLLQQQYDAEQALLEESLKKADITYDLYNSKKELSDKKFAASSKEIDKTLASQKQANNISMVSDGLNALGQLFEGSKAVAVAQSLVNTYQGIAAGVALGYPAAIPAVAFAAASGFAAVKNILKTTKTSTGGSEAPSAPTLSNGSFVNSAQTSTVATVSEKPIEQNTVVSPPVLVLETLQEVTTQQQIKIASN